MKKILAASALMLAFACNNGAKENAATDSTVIANTAAESPDRCYAYITDRDTVKMNLVLDGKSVSGNLSYKLYEKDSNTGTLQGTMQGDTLLAEYSFASEGVQSVREVRFLKNDDILVEGTGDMQEANGRMVYKNPAAVRYMGGLVLKRVKCD